MARATWWKPALALVYLGKHHTGCLFSVEVDATRGVPAFMEGFRLAITVRKAWRRPRTARCRPRRAGYATSPRTSTRRSSSSSPSPRALWIGLWWLGLFPLQCRHGGRNETIAAASSYPRSPPHVLFWFKEECGEPVPATPLRTLLDKIFGGDSPYAGFPPEHTATGMLLISMNCQFLIIFICLICIEYSKYPLTSVARVMTGINLAYNLNISAFGNHVTFVTESGEVIDHLLN
jgi:hypothetical protein